MKIVKRKITELIAAEYNPRKINKVQEQDLKDSLTRFGLVDPIIININKERKNIVIGGHQRLRVWADLGNTEIDCNQLDLTLDKERELNIRLNKNGGSFDDELVKEYFDYEELTEWGFTPDELFDKEETTADGLIDDDEIPEAKESKVKLGDIWKLGEHKIMCEDSTDINNINKLIKNENVNLLFTDPPYGISVVSKKGNIGKGVLAKEGNYRSIIGDDKYFDPSYLLDIGDKQIIWGANYFHNMLPLETSWIVWDKDRPKGTTFSDCELAWTNKKGVAIKKYKCIWNGMIREGESEKRLHPTQKPLKICVEIIKDFIENKKLILDLFLGSGSTLIAAEKLNKKCYGMELDEKYCDVIIERWEQFTGLKAEKING